MRRNTALLLTVSLFVGGCGDTPHGVEVYNDTGQVLHAEMLTVNARGESRLYASSVVNAGAMMEHRMESPVQGQAMRVRFTLSDQSVDDNNWVMLNLPPEATRTYSLRLENGRLRAEEFKGGHKPREQKTTSMSGGN